MQYLWPVMTNKYRIVVLGLGGVGAALGAKLATHYSNSESVEIIFIARGANEQAIREKGLQFITPNGTQTIHPHVITSHPEGHIDLLICCAKTYTLEESIRSLAPCIDTNTFVLPILNGVDSSEKIKAIVPQANVLYGCIYIVSKLLSPGVVEQISPTHALHFGNNELPAEQIEKIASLLKDADINANAEENIKQRIWEKFTFISPIATYTSAYNKSIGKILEEPKDSAALLGLTKELLELAASMNISLPEDIIEKNFAVMAKMPYQTTSSMQADFVAGRNTELETLTGFVVKKARENGLHLDTYEKLYELLLK